MAASQIAPEDAEVALRRAIFETYVLSPMGAPASPQDRLDVQGAIDDIIAHLDLKTMSDADFQALAGQLGLDPQLLLTAGKAKSVKVHDLESRR